MKEILQIWIKDKIQLSIWLLCTFLIGATLTLLPDIQCSQELSIFFHKITPKLLASSLLLNISLTLSFAVFIYKNRNKTRIANNKKDVSPVALEILCLFGKEGNVQIPTQAFSNALNISFQRAQAAIDELLSYKLLSYPLNLDEETAYYITADGRRYLTKHNLL